jgi:hypothetical protein
MFTMAKKHVFISFDYDNDEFLKTALVGQSKYPDSPFEFADHSIKEHLTGDWVKKAEPRIKGVDVVVVICGEKTHTASGVSAELRIAQQHKVPYFFLSGYSDRTCTKPIGAAQSDKLYRWTWDNLKALINGSR